MPDIQGSAPASDGCVQYQSSVFSLKVTEGGKDGVGYLVSHILITPDTGFTKKNSSRETRQDGVILRNGKGTSR